jgi:hypothetical protein
MDLFWQVILWAGIIGLDYCIIVGLIRHMRRPGRHYEGRQEDESGSA